MKIHARVRGQGWPDPPMWVGNDDQWQLMRTMPEALVCAEDGCGLRVTPVERMGTRFLRFANETRTCDHYEVGEGHRYSPPSPKRLWMIKRLAEECRQLGYWVVEEHPASGADVFVVDTGLCIQVQLGPTNFKRRTAMRERRGHSVLWLVDTGTTGQAGDDGVFRYPAARFRVIDRAKHSNDSDRLIEPWTNSDLNRSAGVEIFGTVVVRPPRPGQRPTGRVNSLNFLRQVISGNRQWIPPDAAFSVRAKSGRKQGAWVFTPAPELPYPVPAPGARTEIDVQQFVTNLCHQVVANFDRGGRPNVLGKSLNVLRHPFPSKSPILRAETLSEERRTALVSLAVQYSGRPKTRSAIDGLAASPDRLTAFSALLLADVVRKVGRQLPEPRLTEIAKAADQFIGRSLAPGMGYRGSSR